MFFLAGLLVAGLAGLIILPAFARRALRLSAARARMLAPLSMKEVVAERDLLRAEHALETHRLERRAAALQDASARQRADLGRQAGEIVALEDKAVALNGEIAGLRGEVAARVRDILGLEGELGAARIVLNDFTHRLDRAGAQIASLQDKLLALETTTDDQRAVIAGLETRASGLEMKLSDAAQTAKSKAAAAQAETVRLSTELAWRGSEIDKLNGELADALAKRAALAAELEKRNGELDQARQRLSAQAAESGAKDDSALREAIARLGADIIRLKGASDGEAATRAGAASAPSSQGPDAAEDAAPAKLRQLQSTAQGR